MRSRLAASAMAAAAVLAACGGGSESVTAATTTDAAPGSSVTAAPDAPEIGTIDEGTSSEGPPNEAVNFVGTDFITGEAVDLASLSQADLVIWFWAPW